MKSAARWRRGYARSHTSPGGHLAIGGYVFMGAVVGSEHCLCPQEDVAVIADLIDRPMCHDLVEHKQDPFIPGKRMVDGYFHCSDCGWDGQIWEHIGFGDMLAYEAVHCPKCGAIIERRA